jgi:hypothetical protein
LNIFEKKTNSDAVSNSTGLVHEIIQKDDRKYNFSVTIKKNIQKFISEETEYNNMALFIFRKPFTILRNNRADDNIKLLLQNSLINCVYQN